MDFERWRFVLPLRLRSLFRSSSVDSDLDEELQYHIERQIELNVARGMSRPRRVRPRCARLAASSSTRKRAAIGAACALPTTWSATPCMDCGF